MSYFEGDIEPERCMQDTWGYNHRFTVWLATLAVGGSIGV